MEKLWDQKEDFGELKLPIISDHISKFPFQNDNCCSLETRLAKRFCVLDEFGDLTIFSTGESKDLLCKLDSFIWNLWRQPVTEMLIDDDEDESVAPPVTSSSITTDMSKEAILCMVKFMYTGEIDGNLSELLEISEKAKSNGRNELIAKAAQQKVASKISLESLMEIWNGDNGNKNLTNSTLVNYSVSYILSCPDDAFATADGKVWQIPAQLLGLLVPLQLAKYLPDYQAASHGQWTCKTNLGQNHFQYIEMDHWKLAEFLYLWARQSFESCVTTTEERQQQQDNIPTILELHHILGDLFSMLNEDCFNVTKMDKNHINQTTHVEVARGIYYYYIIVLAQFISDPEKRERKANTFKLEFSGNSESEEIGESRAKRLKLETTSRFNLHSFAPQSAPLPMTSTTMDLKNPILQLLRNEFDNPSLADIHFRVDNLDEIIKASSFVLSLWSEIFFSHFQHDKSFLHVFKLGKSTVKDVKLFIKALYTEDMPSKDGLDHFLGHACRFRVVALISKITPFMSSNDLNAEVAVIRYMAEKAINDEKKMASYFSFMKSNIKEILNSESIATHADKDLLEKLILCQLSEEDEFQKIEAVWRWCKYQCILQNTPLKHASTLIRQFSSFFNLENITNEQLFTVQVGMELLTHLEAYKICEERGKKLGSK